MSDGIDADKRETLRRFAAAGAAPFVGFAGQTGDDDSTSRAAIRGYLVRTPGAHFSKLRDDLGLGTGEAQHHLRRLERRGVVESDRDGDYRRFFPAGRFSAFERTALGWLRRETPGRMLLALLDDPDATASDLADEMGLARSTISGHAADMEAAGLLTREDGYAIERPEAVLVLAVRYAESLGPAAVALADDAADLIALGGADPG
ncbi:MarR family transcriptional regulator [Halobacteriales archaeon SW_7_68_16]|nr:MAG: MarR family transcriptional regulator [Halobacteriales archaeon SW_7_68_16]